jgi:hypothetical protein
MRTTLTIDDEIAESLKETAYRTDQSFKQVVNETLRAGIAAGQKPEKPRRYRLEPVSLGGVRPGFDLDRALKISDALEDREIAGKLEERK